MSPESSKREDPYLEHHGIVEEPDEEEVIAPSLLNMSPLLRPYQNLIALYGQTNYSELNPAFILFFMFPIIFGLMFGDIGHGICLMGAGVLGAFLFRKNSGTKSFSWIIFYCGIGAIFGGFMYGEAFGHHYFISEHLHLTPWLVNPMEEGGVMVIVKISIVVGVVVICLGFAMRGINYVINRKKYLAFSESVFKILLLIGGTIIILRDGFDMQKWFAPPFPPVMMVIIPALLIILLQVFGKLFRLTSYLKKKTYGDIIGHSTLDLAETFLL